MEISDKEAGMVDCSVGSIVWVRRRNGSWWPGKILGPEELSAAHLMSPRSGTPVKLLGREDASVDWYNLEKSKRVKAFRCGEFDDCIERAESSLGMPPKKREKYARREDAILHALELEKQLLEKKSSTSASSNGKSCKVSDNAEQQLPPDCLAVGNGEDVQPKLYSQKLGSTIEDKGMHQPLHAKQTEEGHLLVQDENSDVVPRMRDLQDFGLMIAPSKRKLASSVTLNGYQLPEFDSNSHLLPTNRLGVGSTIHANGQSTMDDRKKSNEILTDESLVRRRDRRRPLVQVMESSAKLQVHHSLQHDNVSILESGEEQTADIRRAKRSRVEFPGESSDCSDGKQFCINQMAVSPFHFDESNSSHPAALDEENIPESMESTETDSTETESLDSDAAEEMVALSDAALVTELEPKSLGRPGAQVQHGSLSIGEPDKLALTSDMSHLDAHDPVTAGVGVSKWQLKGKRNNRSLTKRSTAVGDRRVSRSSMYRINLEEGENYGYEEHNLIEKDFRTRVSALDHRGYLSTSKFTSKDLDKISSDMIDWEDLAWNDHSFLRGYWEDSRNYFDPVFVGHRSFGGRMRSLLVDVDLKVQSSYQREHVPMISLMSKLNGQAIVGHPIQIEALENGSSGTLLSAAEGICSEALDNDTSLPPMWRTARRTANFRIPRSHPSTTIDGRETVGHFPNTDLDAKILSKKSNAKNRKHARKPSKKMRLSSSQKIKTLSSIGKEQKFGNDLKRGINGCRVNGLIKGESGPPAVACIPVKLVFSRLQEELVGRHQ
ncbi:hypothetical protein NMG60_11019998 [Bertholletia excelsa]